MSKSIREQVYEILIEQGPKSCIEISRIMEKPNAVIHKELKNLHEMQAVRLDRDKWVGVEEAMKYPVMAIGFSEHCWQENGRYRCWWG